MSRFTLDSNLRPDGPGKKRGRFRLRPLFVLTTLLGSFASSSPAFAGATVKISEDASLSIGLGLRTSYTNTENGAANGTSDSNDFAVENARLYLGGTFGKIFKATMNFNASGGTGSTNGSNDSLKLIDGIARFEFAPAFNLWLGRMLPPSDRANLYGPFYTVGWAFPGVAQNYPAATAGRDSGAMVWGDPMGGKLSYSFGVFNGHNRQSGLSNQSHKILYAGRLEANFLDPQTGYYRDGTYFGSKNLLSVGLAAFNQSSGVGTAAAPGNLKIWSIDGIFETKTAGGFVPTIEGIYYKYRLGALDCGSGEVGAVGCAAAAAPAALTGDNLGGQVAGDSYILTGALLIPGKIGYGQLQPFVRFQKYDRDVSQTTRKAAEFGLNYIISGPNAKVSAVYTQFEDDRTAAGVRGPNVKTDQFVIGVQLQY